MKGVEGIRRTKIVATLGPATRDPQTLEALLQAGVDVVRLNFSHGTPEEHGRTIELVRTLAKRLDRSIAILQDLQGPKIRTGPLAGGRPVELKEGAELTLTTDPVEGTSALVSVTYPDLPRDVRPGDRILLADGTLELRVVEVSGGQIRTVVVKGGSLREHSGINLPGVAVRAPFLTEKDLADLEFGITNGVDYIALSFVRSAEDLQRAREVLKVQGVSIPLVAKLERPEAIDDLEAILTVSDGVMVARGDLGVELGPEKVPMLQKAILRRANEKGVVAITATQMLESMIGSPRPTRAEASDVANAILDGTDALMLSGETAVGAYPVEAVAMMDRIAREVEAASPQRTIWGEREAISEAHAISHAARTLAEDLSVQAIVAFTRTGRTARLLSKDRPRVPILAFTPDEKVARALALWWGVTPLLIAVEEHTDALIARMEQILLERGLAAPGERVIVVGTMPLQAGTHTNFVKLHHIGLRRKGQIREEGFS